MPMPAGTIAFTNGSTAVTGTDTTFTTDVAATDFIVVVIGGTSYMVGVTSVESDTGLTLVRNFDGPTTDGLTYRVVPVQTMQLITSQLSADIAAAFRGFSLDKSNWQQVLTGTGDVTITLPDGTTYTGPAWGDIINKLANKMDLSGGTFTGTVNGTVINMGDVSNSKNYTSLHGGYAELYNSTPFLDFHYDNTSGDYDTRIINNASGTMSLPSSGTNASNGYAQLLAGSIKLYGSISHNTTALLRSSLSNLGFAQSSVNAFDIPGASRTMRIVTGTAVVALNTSSEATVTYPTAFTSALVGVLVCLADATGATSVVVINFASTRTTSFDIHAYTQPSSSVRVNYIAIGY